MNLHTIILAAGKGTRMKSRSNDISKVSYPMLGKPLIGYVLDAIAPLNSQKVVTIVGFGGEMTKNLVIETSEVVWQHELKGTGHAIMQTAPVLENLKGMTLIVSGDVPLIKAATLKQLIEKHIQNKAYLTILSAILENPFGYGRIIRDKNDNVIRVVEQVDAHEKEQLIKEINAGIYVFDNEQLFKGLANLKPNNKQGEYYLTDLIKMFFDQGLKVDATIVDDFSEILGINDRKQLAQAAHIMKNRINERLMEQGVTIEDPQSVYIGPDVNVLADTTIKPGSYIMGKTTVGYGNVIGPQTTLENMVVGDENIIIKSHLVNSQIGNLNKIGPFTHIREKSVIKNKTRIGNFVEIKTSTLSDNAKAAHHTYIGDTFVDEGANIGCGTITANYDGQNKWKTYIGKNVFVGSGTTFIAPVTIADNSFIAAGSTINKDVGVDGFAIARARQENKEGYATEIRRKIAAKKK